MYKTSSDGVKIKSISHYLLAKSSVLMKIGFFVDLHGIEDMATPSFSCVVIIGLLSQWNQDCFICILTHPQKKHKTKQPTPQIVFFKEEDEKQHLNSQ